MKRKYIPVLITITCLLFSGCGKTETEVLAVTEVQTEVAEEETTGEEATTEEATTEEGGITEATNNDNSGSGSTSIGINDCVLRLVDGNSIYYEIVDDNYISELLQFPAFAGKTKEDINYLLSNNDIFIEASQYYAEGHIDDIAKDIYERGEVTKEQYENDPTLALRMGIEDGDIWSLEMFSQFMYDIYESGKPSEFSTEDLTHINLASVQNTAKTSSSTGTTTTTGTSQSASTGTSQSQGTTSKPSTTVDNTGNTPTAETPAPSTPAGTRTYVASDGSVWENVTEGQIESIERMMKDRPTGHTIANDSTEGVTLN